MFSPTCPAAAARARDLQLFRDPRRWASWPFLPVARRRPDGTAELGVLYDARRVLGRYGFSATVFLCNLYLLPDRLEDFFALPRCVYDTPDELADGGWTAD